MDIYIRIKELREEKKLTQKVVSALIKIDSSQYSKIELGKLQPTLTQIMAISSFFEVSIDWLCFGKGSMLKTTEKSLDYNETNYKELAISRLETIESNHKMICLLEDKIVALNNTIADLKGPSVQRGTVEFLDEPSLKQLSGK